MVSVDVSGGRNRSSYTVSVRPEVLTVTTAFSDALSVFNRTTVNDRSSSWSFRSESAE